MFVRLEPSVLPDYCQRHAVDVQHGEGEQGERSELQRWPASEDADEACGQGSEHQQAQRLQAKAYESRESAARPRRRNPGQAGQSRRHG